MGSGASTQPTSPQGPGVPPPPPKPAFHSVYPNGAGQSAVAKHHQFPKLLARNGCFCELGVLFLVSVQQFSGYCLGSMSGAPDFWKFQNLDLKLASFVYPCWGCEASVSTECSVTSPNKQSHAIVKALNKRITRGVIWDPYAAWSQSQPATNSVWGGQT